MPQNVKPLEILPNATGLRGPLTLLEKVKNQFLSAGLGLVNDEKDPDKKVARANEILSKSENLALALGSNIHWEPSLDNKEVVDKMVDYLLKKNPAETQFIKNETKDPYFLPAKNKDTLKSTIGPLFNSPTQKYLDSIQNWLDGSTHSIRNSALGIKNPYGASINIEDPENMLKLMQATAENPKSATKFPLYRLSNLEEIPEKGQEFYNPFLSFSQNPEQIRIRNIYNSNKVSLANQSIYLEPGAKSLRLRPVSNYTNENEHLVGGKFKVIDRFNTQSGKEFVKLQQIDPNMDFSLLENLKKYLKSQQE